MKMNPPKNSTTQDCSVAYYAVAWIDVLGQSNELEKIKRLPCTVDERNAFIELAKPTFIYMHRFRNRIDDLLNKIQHAGSGERLVTPSWPDAIKEQWKRHNTPNIKRTFIGDAVCVQILLEENSQYHPLRSMLVLMDFLQVLLLETLADGKPLRGGVDVGICCDFNGGIYGQAPGRAYSIEAKRAKYPRVVLGSTLIDYIDSYKKELPSLDIPNFEKKQICINLDAIKMFILKDKDGEFVFNYLANHDMSADQFSKAVEKPIAFVRSCLEKFKNDEKLHGYYSDLKVYFESQGYAI